MRRAPENARYQTTTRRRYMRIILDQGLNMSQRSEPLAYPSEPEGTFIVNIGIVSFASTSSCQFLFDAGATLMEAGYDAIEAEPGNPFVKELLKSGYGPCTVLDARVPRDVERYFIDTLNQLNALGSNKTTLGATR